MIALLQSAIRVLSRNHPNVIQHDCEQTKDARRVAECDCHVIECDRRVIGCDHHVTQEKRGLPGYDDDRP